MCKNLISRKMHGFLSSHIIEIAEGKNLLIEEYYREKVEEGKEVEDFFKEYTRAIRGFLDTTEIGEGNDSGCPLAIIGSTVEVHDMDDKSTYQYRIVLPYSSNTDRSIDYASCLSPLGKALLLTRVNQQVNIQIPAGILRYTVKNISVEEQFIPEYCEIS